MSASDYIKLEIKSFIQNFPKTRVRYEHHKPSNAHFIEIVPNEIYHLDNSYIQWESDFFDRFISEYPCEGICFISDDAVVGLENIDFEIAGSNFATSVADYSVNNNEENFFSEIKILLIGQKTERKDVVFSSNTKSKNCEDALSSLSHNYSQYELAA